MNLRPDYINAIAPFMDKRLVKILVGVRRCGKTTILSMIERELKNRNIAPDHIISRNYSNIAYDDYTAKKMYSDLKAAMNGKGRYYLLLDELQEVEDWEKVVNTLLENENVDIYVTGSNSKLMSSEISTYLTGRYISIPVFTLSFKEYLQFKGKSEDDAKTLFDDYLLYGGFPIVAISNFDTTAAYQVIDGIYATVITRDISKRHKLRNKELFDRVVKYIVENVGKTFSANAIRNFLKSEHRSVSIESIYNYIRWLSEAFIIYPCQRYDLQGKSVLKTQEKYYLSDISLKYSQMGFNRKMVSSLLENIVYLELRRRGYDVYIGKQAAKEIDFVAIRRNERIYIQVCDQFPEDSSRETENLINIKDHYHKYVVCRDPLALGNDNGINIVHIADFLLTDSW